MIEQENQSLNDDQLIHQLNLQSQQVDRILQPHNLGQVSGGTVTLDNLRFEIHASISNSFGKARNLAADLKKALGARALAITEKDENWSVQIPREDMDVPLLELLAQESDPAPLTATIGQGENGQSTILDFTAGSISNIFITGQPGSGKTTLLRTIAVSLALRNRQADLQLLIIDTQSESNRASTDVNSLRPLAYLPHMLTNPAFDFVSAAEMLHFLRQEMAFRRQQRLLKPEIVLFIDHAVQLMELDSGEVKNPGVVENLLSLLQKGPDVGIHLVLATSHSQSRKMDTFFRSLFSQRLAGRMANESTKAGGASDSGTDYLRGSGDFLSKNRSGQTRFQAAAITDYALHWALTKMVHQTQPRLLARPFDIKPRLGKQRMTESPKEATFVVESGVVTFD